MAMKARKNKSAVAGKTRYSSTERREILDFIDAYDAEHGGRGGILAARRRFGVSPPTIRAWREAAQPLDHGRDWRDLARERLREIENEARQIRSALGL